MAHPSLSQDVRVYAELVVDEAGSGKGNRRRVVGVCHVAHEGADTALCHVALSRLHSFPELRFTPRPPSMQRCSGCFSAYAVLPSRQAHRA